MYTKEIFEGEKKRQTTAYKTKLYEHDRAIDYTLFRFSY